MSEPIGSALGLFASAIKSGEDWSPVCQRAADDAWAALTDLRVQLADARKEIADALVVLAPSMPENGLVDAARQRQQAYVTERDNAADALRQRDALADVLVAVLATRGGPASEEYVSTKAFAQALEADQAARAALADLRDEPGEPKK